ncbi:MAG: hypothetical protein ACOYVF_09980, partial [Candidatus Zixiibacteriota bacterium]
GKSIFRANQPGNPVALLLMRKDINLLKKVFRSSGFAGGPKPSPSGGVVSEYFSLETERLFSKTILCQNHMSLILGETRKYKAISYYK